MDITTILLIVACVIIVGLIGFIVLMNWCMNPFFSLGAMFVKEVIEPTPRKQRNTNE